MPTIKGTILAKDIKETSYLNVGDCAITRALRRAGYDLQDAGKGITKHNPWKFIVDEDNLEYKELSDTVCRMYGYTIDNKDPLEPKDFNFEINYL